jgi:hypothetical protein
LGYREAMYAARRAVARAVHLGDLPHPSKLVCMDCGNTATEYDHRDYSQPLSVDPVCHGCNMRRGPALFRRELPRPYKHQDQRHQRCDGYCVNQIC